ncbi:hypothetical protein BpHYR1_046844 [Brachionus plicatilis]|uniref:Uncharacterized protein n=1 Tax=Brachionus plicatilis TaxID=10195 RepID=A0A3M7S0A1_BRAPC|nr:hypothetical protein BpHYR1_046844 [Brachionus plicatilis]
MASDMNFSRMRFIIGGAILSLSTNLTACGGFFIALTSDISFGLIVLRALIAASRAGVASAKSFSQSSLMD